MLEIDEIYLIYVNSDCTLDYFTQSYELNGPDWNFNLAWRLVRIVK